MYLLTLLLLHVKQQARAEQDFHFQPTANISLSCLFRVFTMSTSHFFGEIYFCFSQKEIFSKSNKFVFQVRLACE